MGETYCLTQNILNSATSSCINITADNITFDGQGYTIDGDDVATFGIYLSRAASTTTGVTIKNCTVSDWDNNIRLEYANGDTLNENQDNSVKIVKEGVISGDEKSIGTTCPNEDAYVSYGNSTDLWGEIWAVDDINNSGFGFVISQRNTDDFARFANVDHIRITVYYTAP